MARNNPHPLQTTEKLLSDRQRILANGKIDPIYVFDKRNFFITFSASYLTEDNELHDICTGNFTLQYMYDEMEKALLNNGVASSCFNRNTV